MIRFNSKNEFNTPFGNRFKINRKYHYDLDVLKFKNKDFYSQTSAKFGISNVFEHKGRSNKLLKEFAKEYNVYYLNKSYHAWNNASKNKSDKQLKCIYVIMKLLKVWKINI